MLNPLANSASSSPVTISSRLVKSPSPSRQVLHHANHTVEGLRNAPYQGQTPDNQQEDTGDNQPVDGGLQAGAERTLTAVASSPSLLATLVLISLMAPSRASNAGIRFFDDGLMRLGVAGLQHQIGDLLVGLGQAQEMRPSRPWPPPATAPLSPAHLSPAIGFVGSAIPLRRDRSPAPVSAWSLDFHRQVQQLEGSSASVRVRLRPRFQRNY